MITLLDQTVTGKKIFRNLEGPEPPSNNQPSSKKYLDDNFMHKNGGIFLVQLV